MRILGALFVCACGPVQTPDVVPDAGATPDAGDGSVDGAKSGTRLKLAWTDFGGTRAWANFFDAQRGEACGIDTWSDGNAYCIPNDSAQTSFKDAACTQVVGRVYQDTSCTAKPAPKYLVQYDDGACSYAPTHLYQRGAKTTVASYYSKGSDGTCYGPYSGTGYDFYATGTEVIPAHDLVALVLGSPLGATRLDPRDYTTADGFRYPAAIHDAVAGIDCTPQSPYAGATEATCVPTESGYASYFRDATCTSGELAIDRSCRPPQFAVSYADECVTTRGRYYAVGAVNTPSSIYYKSDATCSATTASPSTERYYALGNELVLGSVARAPDTDGTHRVVPIHDAWEGHTYRESTLYDSMTGSECAPFTFADGTVRCLPAGYGTSTYYTNSTCTAAIELMSLYSGGPSCAAPPLPSYALTYVPDTAGACKNSYDVHPVAAAYTGTVYEKFGTSCFQLSGSYEVFYRVGATLPLSMFATGTHQTDP